MENSHTYIIAEAGVNHNGDINIAYNMIDAAKKSGVDCIKFQTFRTEKLVTITAKKAEYQVENTHNNDSQFEMLKKLELSFEDFKNIKKICDKVGIEFMSTPFDMESVDLLEKLGMKTYKISSGDITNKPLLEFVASKNKPIILSTGMCTMDEVQEAVNWIENKGNKQLALLHCTSNYPTPYSEVNMNAMITLDKAFSYPIGYSDHTKGIIIPIMAVSMGAKIIEKHFTLDKTMEGPDHKASLDVRELKKMVNAIRNIEKAKGTGEKLPVKSEISTRDVVRKSIIVTRDLKSGSIILETDLDIKRPGTGLAPKYISVLVGKRLNKNLSTEDFISFEDTD